MNNTIQKTTSLLVWNYFDELINNLDIYTEKSLEKIAKNEEQELIYNDTWMRSNCWINPCTCKNTKCVDEPRNEILANMPENPTQIE
jgi:hypothetical protein